MTSSSTGLRQERDQHNEVLQELRKKGWTKLSLSFESRKEFEYLLERTAAMLGIPVSNRNGSEIIEELKPTSTETAHRNSLSRLHGCGRFPLHTDAAHWPVPCRFIILGCIDPGFAKRATLLLDSHTLALNGTELERLRNTPFAFRNGRRSFFSTIISENRNFIRFDPGCMVSKSLYGSQTMAILDPDRWTSHVAEIRWNAGQVLILDNWRILHGRSAAPRHDETRTLLRISIQ